MYLAKATGGISALRVKREADEMQWHLSVSKKRSAQAHSLHCLSKPPRAVGEVAGSDDLELVALRRCMRATPILVSYTAPQELSPEQGKWEATLAFAAHSFRS